MKKILLSIIFVFTWILCPLLATNAVAEKQILSKSLLKTKVITDQLNRPWSLTFLPDGNYLVTEKEGVLRTVSSAGEVSGPIQGLPSISAVGQGGLHDIALHPSFKTNGFIYLSYVAGDPKIGFSTEVIRAVLSPKMAVDGKGLVANNKLQQYSLSDVKKIFVALPKTQGGRHFGGRLAFDREGYLFISLGDRGDRQHSQNLQTHHGSIIRLSDNGDIPRDNPFVSNGSGLPEIYSYGHRNVQGLAMHPVTGEIWSHEHGPQGGDEVNAPKLGKNYGWPVITYGAEYGSGWSIGEGVEADGMEQPLYYWTPSIAPSGMAFFNDDILVGSLKFQLLSVLSTNKSAINKQKIFDEKRLFEKDFGRIRDVRVKDNKTFYLLTDVAPGKLIRVSTETQ
jgi:glucose/arabinose dehydrogenase